MKKTRFIPYGYTMRNGRTVIEHTEADIIREIFEEYIKGASLKDIADDLTKRKIPYTEKTDVWDKARIARIIDNAKYIGDEKYDPIIDEDTYNGAVSMKAARQRNTMQKECDGIALLRSRIKCKDCGSPMARRICSKHEIKESWVCQNPECGKRLRISDSALLQKITILMNRIITNSKLLIPKPRTKPVDSPIVASIQQQIGNELTADYPREDFIVEKIGDIASQLYKETQAKKIIVAQITRKRVTLMTPQEDFNCEYFSDLIDYITLSTSGKVTLHTKVGSEISEGENE